MKTKGKNWSEEAFVLESEHGFHLSYSSSSKEILKDEHAEKLKSKEYKITKVRIEKVKKKKESSLDMLPPVPPKELYTELHASQGETRKLFPVTLEPGYLALGVKSDKEGNKILCLIADYRKKKEKREKRKQFLENLLGPTKEYLKSRKEKLHWKNFIPPFFIP